MVFWRTALPAQQAPTTTASMDHSEEVLPEVDEPPDETNSALFWPPPKMDERYMKATPQMLARRESLLTRQLHSETEQSDEDRAIPPPPRAPSTHSTWSTASTAELTSDDGHSVPSPAISPPLPPTHARVALPLVDKPLDKKVVIVGQDDHAPAKGETSSEQSVEATLGRKRCIMFACGGKNTSPAKSVPPPAAPKPEKVEESSPPKRKCMIKFACSAKSGSETKTANPQPRRAASPPPPQRRSSGNLKPEEKRHRGSDSTVTHASPRSVRKSPAITTTVPMPTTPDAGKQLLTRNLSNASDLSGTEATRFHEFASSDDEPEDWVQEATCHRQRLTISDTLQKENTLRKACEEAEEEAIEEEDEEDAGDEDAAEADDLGEDGLIDELEEDEDEDESEHSDEGFHSDDEEGFADSDSEGESSDYEWWKPGGSTAATSVEHLDRLAIQPKSLDVAVASSSIGSASSAYLSPHSSKHRRHNQRKHAHGVPIHKPEDTDLPDSTDFVCGTLDEDRPLEQAYISRKKEEEAAKHKARPQDIDPTFPTSDPEMDEEDDEDLEDEGESEHETMVHGEMEELEEESTLKRHPSPRPRRNMKGSPAPARYFSPPPTKRMSRHHSPVPAKRGTARSPPPRKLFGQSPKRARSPAPTRMTSPPNSPTRAEVFAKQAHGLAQRPQLTHTASLPRGGGFLLSNMGKTVFDDGEGSDTVGAAHDIPKRGAIDIVQGLKKKREHCREKLYRKMCAKAAAKGEKAYKVKPGRGAERMREVGLELQRYQGKAEHILSL
jgi:hypothetical protein